MSNLLTQAQHLHKHGFNIVPVGVWHKADDSERPRQDFKTPFDQPNEGYEWVYKAVRGKWKHLREERQAFSEITEYYLRGATGIGCVTGSTPVFCIDFDSVPNLSLIDRITEVLGLPMPYPWVSISGSKRGFHVWLRCDSWDWMADDKSAYTYHALDKSQFDHLELRVKQHTVLPPSMHKSGNTYEWLHDLPDSELATVGEQQLRALLELCQKLEPKPQPTPPTPQTYTGQAGDIVDKIEQGFDWRLYVSQNMQDGNRVKRDGHEWRIGRSGAGYGTVCIDDRQSPFKWNHPQSDLQGGIGAISLVRFISGGMRFNGIDYKEALYIAAKYAGVTEDEIKQSAREYMQAQEQSRKVTPSVLPVSESTPEEPSIDDIELHDLANMLLWGGVVGLSDVFQILAHNKYCYDKELGIWHEYRNGLWEEVSLSRIYRVISDEVSPVLWKVYYEIEDDDTKDQWHKVKSKLKNPPTLKNIELMSQSLVSVKPSDFDQQHHVVILRNGVYDLQADKFLPHSPTYLAKTRTDIPYIKGNKCPKWLAFLDTIFCRDAELIRFVRQWVGLSLTGFTDFQGLFFAFGGGKNGKSVFFNALTLLLGEYLKRIKIDTIANKNRQRSAGEEAQIAGMKGARLVLTSEVSQGERLDEAAVKDLTGGEPITAKRMHKNPITFNPTHKLAMFGNHKPPIKGTDKGFWRRMYLVPFNATIPESQRREMSVILAEFQAEIAGMLNWAIEGYRDYKKNGIKVAKVMDNARDEYKRESDPLGDFLEECYVQDPTCQAVAQTMWEDYKGWCKNADTVVVFHSRRTFYRNIEERGYPSAKGRANVKVFCGIAKRYDGSGFQAKGDKMPF